MIFNLCAALLRPPRLGVFPARESYNFFLDRVCSRLGFLTFVCCFVSGALASARVLGLPQISSHDERETKVVFGNFRGFYL